ncbi:MAG: rod-binding protein [Kiloniellaceae bacterium]
MNATDIAASLARFKPSPAEAALSHGAAKRVAQEFEALFLSEMLSPVFESVDTDGLFGGGRGEEIYRSMMVQEYGKAIARAGGVGIADTVQREILKMQENQQ